MAWKCEKCGFCCCGKGSLVHLTKEEIESGLYKMVNTKRGDGRKVVTLPKKTFFHRRLGIEVEGCFYLNLETFLCETHSQKPVTCKLYTCENKEKSKPWSKK